MTTRKEIKFSLFLVLFLLIPVTELYAQKDTAKAKNYSIRIAGDVDVEESGVPYLVPGYSSVWGFNCNLIIENKKNTGIVCGIGYGEKEFKFINQEAKGEYALIPICFRHDSKIIYYGLGLAGEFKVGEAEVDMPYPFSYFEKANLGLTGFIGVNKRINNCVTFFVQGGFLQDLFSPYPAGININGFRNYGITLGVEYLVN